jgi:hypothetical protein
MYIMPPETQPCLLTILADTAVRSALIDWLLNYSQDMVFSNAPVEWHGIDPTHFSVAEQVTGRQSKLLLQVQTSFGEAQRLCEQLGQAFAGAQLRYWIQPVLEAGMLTGERVPPDAGKS